jgi:hypothetical protein
VTTNIREILSNHRRIIVIVIAIAAISSYLAPFDKLVGLNSAEAAPGGKKCPPPGLDHGKGRKYGILKHAHCAVDAGNQAGQTGLDNAKKVAPPQAQGRLDAAKQDLQARTDNAHKRIDQAGAGIPDDSPTTSSKDTTKASNNGNTHNNGGGPSKTLKANNNGGGSSSNDNGGSNNSGHSKADNAKSKASDAKSKASDLRQHASNSGSKKST